MSIILQYTTKARKDLAALNKSSRERIILKLDFFCYKSNPMPHAKALSGDFKGLYRFRIGDYRVVFQKNDKGKLIILTVIRIKHRKDVYE